jgi:hypothetical protein
MEAIDRENLGEAYLRREVPRVEGTELRVLLRREKSRSGTHGGSMSGSSKTEAAVRHIVELLAENPDYRYLMGEGTRSWELLTEAYAEITGKNAQWIQENMRYPGKGQITKMREELGCPSCRRDPCEKHQ